MKYEGAGARVNFNFPEVAVSRVPGATRDVSKRDEQRCAEENLSLFCPLPRYIYDPRGRRPSLRARGDNVCPPPLYSSSCLHAVHGCRVRRWK